jgi:hypothetical protein
MSFALLLLFSIGVLSLIMLLVRVADLSRTVMTLQTAVASAPSFDDLENLYERMVTDSNEKGATKQAGQQ